MITHTRSELPCCVERLGVEWPVAPVLRLGEVIKGQSITNLSTVEGLREGLCAENEGYDYMD